MEDIIHILHHDGYLCVIASYKIRTSAQRGVVSLYNLPNNKAAFLKEASGAAVQVQAGKAQDHFPGSFFSESHPFFTKKSSPVKISVAI